MDRVQFLSALATAKPNDNIVYHVGSLAFDCHIKPEVRNVAAEASAAYLAKKVTLVQRRTGRTVCETENGTVREFQYIAVKK